MDLCDQSTSKDKAKMTKFYLHNMALIDMNVWDPNAKLGDLQLMAMASWMNHEELRAAKMKRMMTKEQNEPLMIRVEPLDPMALVSTHNLLSNDPQIAPKYLANQEQAIAHFEDMFRLLGEDFVHACMRRWNTLPHSLQIREYHSPMSLREALKIMPMYKRSMQRLKVNWIGLQLSPPLLLGMLEGRREEEEKEQWKCYTGIMSTPMLLFPLECVAILETNNQSLLLIPFMKIDERRTKRANLSLALDFLSFLIEFCRFLFVCSASKGPVES